VKYEIRNFPLPTHPYADLAAEAALCAAKQDAFEKMHDLLFTNHAEWTAAPDPGVFFRQYATNIGIGAAAFSACVSSREMRSAIDLDKADASDAGISGTPSFWIYGADGSVRQINGAYPFSKYKAAFDASLQLPQQ
jgi:protein-disulfide isomerase